MRRLNEAPAMAPVAPVTRSSSRTPVSQFLRAHELEAEVMAAWAVWIALRHLQSILGPMRRRSGHWSVKYSAMAAYYLPTAVVFYMADAVYSSSSEFKDLILSVGCSILLISCARGAVTMTAFTLGGDPLRLKCWQLLPALLYFTWLHWGLLSGTKMVYIVFLWVVPLLYVLLVIPGVAILDYETKYFADYMVRESRSSSPFFDGDAITGLQDSCKYPIIRLEDGQWITFSDDLLRRRDQLTGETAVDLDTCLSYSFCRLLARRCFGFPCPEDGSAQVRDFVLTELPQNYSRAFTIVEVQLAFLHDYFFTSYHSKIHSATSSAELWIFYGTGSLCLLVFLITRSFDSSGGLSVDLYRLCVLAAIVVPVYLTTVVLMLPYTPVLPTYWHPIQHLINCYRPSDSPVTNSTASPDPSRQSQTSPKSHYWRNKIGQYSVIEDYDHGSYKNAFIAWCKVHVLSQVPYRFIRRHPAKGKDVDVPDSLRRFLAEAIKGTNGAPTMGTRSLGDKGLLDDLSWTCRQETLTHTILIWHVATCYCDMPSEPLEVEEDVRQPQQEGSTARSLEEPSTSDDRAIATTLAKYCAYLVAFLPEVLPEHCLTVRVVFQQVLQQPRKLLGKKQMSSMSEKRRKIQGLQLEEDVSKLNAFEKGVRLGQFLEQKPCIFRWKVMADFWAEMIICAASSDNGDTAAAHMEQLAQGGEFVTHIWALLCNAGITEHATEEWTRPDPNVESSILLSTRNKPAKA